VTASAKPLRPAAALGRVFYTVQGMPIEDEDGGSSSGLLPSARRPPRAEGCMSRLARGMTWRGPLARPLRVAQRGRTGSKRSPPALRDVGAVLSPSKGASDTRERLVSGCAILACMWSLVSRAVACCAQSCQAAAASRPALASQRVCPGARPDDNNTTSSTLPPLPAWPLVRPPRPRRRRRRSKSRRSTPSRACRP
jgi:hypothetical protein